MTNLSKSYNLQKLCPALAKEWHPKNNGNLTPKDVTPGSGRKVWWICRKNKTHEWEATVNNRSNGNGCPYCSGQKACKDNCLKTLNPELAKEWHSKNNGNLTTEDVTPGSGRKVWWLCSKNKSHEWEATVKNRSNGNGCPYCSGKKACIDNSLKTLNPDLSEEWHPTKNGSLTPKDVTPGAHKKVWWLCGKNKTHEWNAAIYCRKHGTGCPYCSKRRRC